MKPRPKWFLVIAALLASIVVALFLKSRNTPVEQQIMTANSLQFLGEDFPLDGGSRAFFFYLPRNQYLILLVRHRRPVAEGGNPDFQEILVQDDRGYQT